MKLLFCAFLIFMSGLSHANTNKGDWPNYAKDLASSKFSELSQINKTNLGKLKVVWRWTSPDQQILKDNPKLFTFSNEATPIAIDGNLYVSTSMSQVVKIDGATGKTLWTYDPQAYHDQFPPNNGYVHRGVTYWKSSDGQKERIFIGTGNAYLVSVDAKTGTPDTQFGNNGRIDLLKDISSEGDFWLFRWQYGVTSPVTVCKDVIIVGSSNMDGVFLNVSVRGDVRGFDPLTGKMKWRFHTIPTANEFGVDTWKNNSWLYTGNTNVWTMMSADEKNGLVYLPVSTPTNDWFGGARKGDGLFGESLVCLSCLDGVRKWHYQLVHHGLWDYDPPAAPNLVDIQSNGKTVQAVVQITKQGFAYVFDRVSGEPIWPILEKPVPSSPLEWTSPTQPFPTKPLAFDRQGVSKEDLLDQETEKIVDQYVTGPLFTPGSDQKKGTLVVPGWIGGGSWAGAAFDPSTHKLYVSSITNPIVVLLESSFLMGFNRSLSKSFVTDLDGKPYNIPLFKPPYGRVTAIDLDSGDTSWQVPLGEGPRYEPRVKAGVQNTKFEGQAVGWPRRGHMLLTHDILFVGQQGDMNIIGAAPLLNALKVAVTETPSEQNLKAFDPATGDLLGETSLSVDVNGQVIPGASGNAYGAPMTFLDQTGKQVIVVPVGGANLPAELVGLGI